MASRPGRPSAGPAPIRGQSAEGTGTVHRVVRLLSAMAAREDVGVGDLAQRLSLPVPTIHRLLHLLRKEGMVDWNRATHRYSIGPDLYRLAAQVTATVSLPRIAQVEIDRLAAATQESVLFGVYQPGSASMAFAARGEGSHPLQYRIQMHTPLSLVWGASGKAILAYLAEDVLKRALANEIQNAQNGAPPPTRQLLDEELERIRHEGYAVSEGEKLLGARGVAAPVFGVNGIVGSICITSPKERIPISRISEFGAFVKDAATRLSHSLGAPDESAE